MAHREDAVTPPPPLTPLNRPAEGKIEERGHAGAQSIPGTRRHLWLLGYILVTYRREGAAEMFMTTRGLGGGGGGGGGLEGGQNFRGIHFLAEWPHTSRQVILSIFVKLGETLGPYT